MTNPTNILRRTAARRESAFWGPVCVGCIHGACRFLYLLNGTLDRAAPDAQIGVAPDIFGLVHSVTSAFWRLPTGKRWNVLWDQIQISRWGSWNGLRWGIREGSQAPIQPVRHSIKRPKIQVGSKVGYVVQELPNHKRI
jgi:hypothetical protein